MPTSIYVASSAPRSGRSVIVLGLMDMLCARTGRVGFFRPVVPGLPVQDPAIELIAARYGLQLPPEQLCGCDADTAMAMTSAGHHEALHKQIIERFRALEAVCDFVVCSGTDVAATGAAFAFDFNADVANNLGCVMLPVIDGRGATVTEAAGRLQSVLELLDERRCDVVAAAVNRVEPTLVEALKAHLPRTVSPELPAYVLPECPSLAFPTVGDIAQALGATWISTAAGGAQNQVLDFKVAAMELPNFLDHLRDGDLVITPGDRADIVLGTLLADTATTYPRVSGLLLTGDLAPAPQVTRLIDGLAASNVPVLNVSSDTFTTAMDISGVDAGLSPDNETKLATALGLFGDAVDEADLGARLAAQRTERATPLMFEFDLIRRARAERKHIVLPEGTDERILRAAEILLLRGVVDITLLGPEDQVRGRIAALGLHLDDTPVIDPETSPQRAARADGLFELRRHKGMSRETAFDLMGDVSYYGTMMVHLGEADGMVSGAAHTTQHTIRPAFQFIRAAPGCALVSSVFFMCLADRVLVYGDCAVNPDPDAAELAEIASSSADTAMMFGVEPRVAMLSYSSGESGTGADVEKVRQATRLAREKRPELPIEGPIQYDAAVDPAVGLAKMPGSAVAGRATVFVFPDLNTGNNTYKAVQRSAGAVAVGPILQGLNRPVNDLSRGCLVPDIVNTVAITAIQAQTRG
jgi:phosphate acetyltransferase